MRISDWSSDVCSSDLRCAAGDQMHGNRRKQFAGRQRARQRGTFANLDRGFVNGLAHRQIADHLSADAHRIADRYTGAEQDAKRAAEAPGIAAPRETRTAERRVGKEGVSAVQLYRVRVL